MNILLAGIPTRSLLEKIRTAYPGNLNLYVAESRPYEMHVARAISACSSTGIRVTVVTDNMLAALIETVPIQAVWSQYLEIDRTHAAAINGAHLAALLARAYGIPCLLHPISGLPPGESGRFAGEDITVPGAACIAWEPDRVPLELIREVFENA
jgi:methylthioribose-1-phosphate isomerase